MSDGLPPPPPPPPPEDGEADGKCDESRATRFEAPTRMLQAKKPRGRPLRFFSFSLWVPARTQIGCQIGGVWRQPLWLPGPELSLTKRPSGMYQVATGAACALDLEAPGRVRFGPFGCSSPGGVKWCCWATPQLESWLQFGTSLRAFLCRGWLHAIELLKDHRQIYKAVVCFTHLFRQDVVGKGVPGWPSLLFATHCACLACVCVWSA